MRLSFTRCTGASLARPPLAVLTVLISLLLLAADGIAAELPPSSSPPSAAVTAASPAATMAGDMSSSGWLENIAMRLEREATADIAMLPDTPAAIVRQWRSFDRDGSPTGALINVGWVALAACLAVVVERAVARGLSGRLRRRMRMRPEGPTVVGLLGLLLCDIAGAAVFAGLFLYSRHWLMELGVTVSLMLVTVNALIRWRLACVVVRALLRPHEPSVRLLNLPNDEARRLARFLSAALLGVTLLMSFGRYGLADVDSGAPHIVGLIVAALVCGLYALMVYRARAVAEALIRGNSSGLFGALRASIARAWLAIGLSGVAALLLLFWFGLTLGLVPYLGAVVSTVGVVLVLLVFERLTGHGRHDAAPASGGQENGVDQLMARSIHRILSATVVLAGVVAIAWIWIQAIALSPAQTARALMSIGTAICTVFVAVVAWELARVAIDRNLQGARLGPKLPGSDDDGEMAPGSRLQTVLPMLRLGFGVVIAVVATLIVLSHLGVDTAPLIAGAGVFGLALSFGSQALVRDIISGLFYMWDDAFRVGEYIDTGRLKGTVEALGVRSVKVRHHNGPLHTIPYGQLGAVTNQSRDFATIKFNLRLEPRTDIELVRKAAKRIGLEMQEEPEITAEVIVPLKLQGILEVTETALVVRFKFTARPVKPSWVQREYLKRIYRVFAEKGIAFASGALTLRTTSAGAAESEPARLLPAEFPSEPAAGPVGVPAASRVA